MCLIILKFYHLFNKGPKIAKRNIKVYKALIADLPWSISENEFLTPFQKKSVFSKNHQIIMESELDSPEYVHFERCSYSCYIINKGIHAYRTKTLSYSLKLKFNIGLYKAVIPKGSLYYIGKNQEIVSNKLIVYTDKPVKIH